MKRILFTYLAVQDKFERHRELEHFHHYHYHLKKEKKFKNENKIIEK